MKSLPLLCCVFAALRVGASDGLAASALYDNPGSVVAWGENSHGQTDVPTDVTNVVAIAAGGFHNLALRNDGTVVGWGDKVPPSFSGITAVAAFGYHDLGLKLDGTLVAWDSTTKGRAWFQRTRQALSKSPRVTFI